MKPNRRNPLFANIFRGNTLATAVVVSLASLAALPSALAADAYWDVNGTVAGAGGTIAGTPTGAWGTATNWNATATGDTTAPAAWGANNVAIFSAGADAVNPFTVTIATGTTQTINGLTVQVLEGTPTITGGTLALGVAAPFVIHSNATIASVISGAFAITKTGANDKTLTLSGTNTFTGGLTIDNGIVKITKAAALGNATKNITITNGTNGNPSLQLEGFTPFTLPATTTFTTSNSGNNGAIRNLAGNNTIAGTITLAAGGGDTHVYSDADALTLSGGITTNTTARNLVLRGVSTAANTVSGVINNTNTPGVRKDDAGLWILTATNTYAGATVVTAGTLRGTVAGSFGAGALTLAGGTLDLYNAASTTFGRNTTVTGNATILSSRAAAAGAGVTHTLGTLSIGERTLTITPMTANSGVQHVTFGTTTLTGNPTFYVNNNTGVTGQLNLGVITGGSFGLTKTGPGVLVLTGANTFSGPVNLYGGTLRLQNAEALGTTYGPVINVSTSTTGGNGTTLDIANSTIMPGGMTVVLNSDAGGYRSTLTSSSGTNVWNGDVLAVGPDLTQVSTTGSLTVNGTVTSVDGAGTGTLFTRGTGTVTYNGVISMGVDRVFNHTEGGTVIVNSTGNSWLRTQVSDGQIQLGATSALADVDFTFGQGSATNGRFDLNGFSQSVQRLNSWAASTGTNHILRNSNLTAPSTLTFATPEFTTDTLKAVNIYGSVTGLGVLNLVSNGLGRTEFFDAALEADSWTVNSGTVAFTGNNNRMLFGSLTGAVGAIVEKAGTGTLAAGSAWNNAGTTNVAGGTLALGAGTAGAINVADGATLTSGIEGGALSATSVTFGTVGSTTFAPLLGAPSVVAKLAAGTVTTSGTGVVVAPQGTLAAGTYALIDYGTLDGNGFAGFTLAPLGSYPHASVSLVDNTADGRLDLVVGTVDSLIWTGSDSAVWDIATTPNFKLVSDGLTPAGFYMGDAVLFDDNALNRTITGTGASTGALTFTNTVGGDYSIAVPLVVAGNVTKTGEGAVTLSGANLFNGNLAISGGAILLSGANTINGNVTVTGGMLKVGNANALRGAGNVTVSDGGTFDANGIAPGSKYNLLTVSGVGVGGNGAVINSSATAVTNSNHFSTITLTGDTTWGGTSRYDITTPTVFNGGSYTLTKVGANEMWYWPAAGSTLGGVIVNGGTFGVQVANPLAAGTIVTVNTGAFHNTYNTQALQHDVLLNDGGTFQSTNGVGTMNGTVTLAGLADTNRFLGGSATLDIAGKITGAAGVGFTKNGAGAMNIRSTTSDYTGDTRVLAGNLNMSPTGLIPATTNLVMDGGTFDTWDRHHTVGSISGTAGTINTGAQNLWRLTTTQTTATTANTTVNRVIIEMNSSNGLGSLTLGGTADNVSGGVLMTSGTVVLAKGITVAVGQAIHAVANYLTINGGTLQLAGTYNNATAGTGANTPPAGIDTATYGDLIYNPTNPVLNGGILDLNGRQEAVNGVTGAVGATITNTNTSAPAKLYVGHQNGASTIAGPITDGPGVMAVEKLGTSTLTLSGTSTFTGGLTQTLGNTTVTSTCVLGATPITVKAGTFTLDGTHGAGGITLTAGTFKGTGTSAGTLTAATGSTVQVGEFTSGTSTATLTLGGLSLAGSTINLDFNPAGPALDKIVTTETGGLTLNGTNTLNVSLGVAGWVTGKYPVLTYVGALGGTGLTALTVPPVGHGTVTLVDDGPGTISLDVVAGALNKWVGGIPSAWDINATSNWSNPVDFKFLDGDAVVFDDSATTFTPAIAADVKPAGVTFDNTTPYTLSGSATAGIIGTTGLLKKGTGEVTLAGIRNAYTGPTMIENGTLIANYNTGIAAPALPAASAVTVGTGTTLKLVANDANITFTNPRAGDGTIIVDPHLTAAAATREVSLNSTLTTFTGTLRLTSTTDVASGLGTMRTNPQLTAAGTGLATIIVDAGAQAWLGANTFPNNFTITGHGFAEGAGGNPLPESGLTAYTGTNKGGIGAIRMDGGCVITGTITLNGTAKIMSYGNTGTVAGSIGTTNATDKLVIGGGGSGTNILLTGTNNVGVNCLKNIFVNSGSTTAQGNLLSIGNNTTTGTLGTGSVALNGDGGSASLRFDRSDGYTLAAGNTITSSGTNTTNTQVRIETQASTFNQNGVPINLGTGLVQIGALRTGVVANLDGTVTAGTVSLGNATLNLTAASALTTGRLATADLAGAVSTINQPAGTVTITGTDNSNLPTASIVLGVGAGATAATTYNLSGTGVITAPGAELGLGWDTEGTTFNQSGGTANFLGLRLASGRSRAATYNLTGGRLNLGASGIIKNVNKTVNVGGATVGAFADWYTGQNLNLTGSLTVNTLDSVDGITGRTVTLAGVLAGASGNLTKVGAGTLVLGTANTYAGTTTVNAGKLWVNGIGGTGANTVAVAATAALGGTGKVSGATTVNGTLEPGNDTVGTLSFGSTLTLAAGSTYAVSIGGLGSNDKLVATGAVTFGGTIAVTLVAGFTPTTGDLFDIADLGALGGTPVFSFTNSLATDWDTTTFATDGTIKYIGLGDPYTAWATLNGVTGGKNGDDDGDGVKNLLEFATNSDAKNAGSMARAYGKLHTLSGDGVLTYTVATRKAALFAASGKQQEATKDKVKYTVEASDELAAWTTVEVTELNSTDSAAVQGSLALPTLDADWEWHTFRTDAGTTTDPSDLIRLKVTEAP
jgi:autotransporter-associated beta strand protein